MSLKTEASIRETKKRRRELGDRLARTRTTGKGITSKEYVRRGALKTKEYSDNPYG